MFILVFVFFVIILSKVDLLIFDLVKILIFWLILIVSIELIDFIFVLNILVIFLCLNVCIGGVFSFIFCNGMFLVFLFNILLFVFNIFLSKWLLCGIIIFFEISVIEFL